MSAALDLSSSASPAMVVGRFDAGQSDRVRLALTRGGLACAAVGTGAIARRALASATPPMIVVDASMIELEPLMAWVRGRASLFGAMVVAVVPRVSGEAFREAIAAGCDDVVAASDVGGLTRRAACLERYDPTARPSISQGRAIIAHPSVPRRRLLGRTFRLAGFDVAFAEDGSELSAVSEQGAALVVVGAALDVGADDAVRRVRAAGVEAPVVVVGTAREVRGIGGPRVAPATECGGPDALLFVANEMLRPGVGELRDSERVLADRLCAYRPAGSFHAQHALTYNVSASGLYVRTLDPLPRGTSTWVELQPPGADEAVHLRGTVMWVRTVEGGPGGSVPPGFGLRFDDEGCAARDLSRWRGSLARLG